MNLPTVPPKRCAVYCRVSSDERLDQSFNSIDAQREAGRAYIVSQRAEGWIAVGDHFEDGGYSGGNMERPALRRLMADIELGKVDVVVVYKIDRLSRALSDFARMVEVFDRHGVSFVSVTQQFNTTTSMGRLTLNILLSFAQFEREVIGLQRPVPSDDVQPVDATDYLQLLEGIPVRPGTKLAALVMALRRPQGATSLQLMLATVTVLNPNRTPANPSQTKESRHLLAWQMPPSAA